MSHPVPFRDQAERALAEDIFGSGLPAASTYAELLAGPGVTWGLLGPREVDRLWDRHLINSAALSSWVPSHDHVLDVGSGAGLPGLPLRLARPDLQLTLVEPLQRRVRFLELCKAELGLADVSIVAVRAEVAAEAHGLTADTVTARAVAPLPRLLAVSWPLIRPGGQLLAIKGRRAHDELAELTACGAVPDDLSAPPDVVSRSSDAEQPLVTVVRFRRRAGQLRPARRRDAGERGLL